MVHFDSRKTAYKAPFGAVETHETVRFRLSFGEDYSEAELHLMIYKHSMPENDILLTAEAKGNSIEFTGSFTPMETGVYHYYFRIHKNHETLYLKKNPQSSAGSISYGEKDGLYQLTVYEKGFSTPDALKGKIMYQIFPDRFSFSGMRKEDVPSGRILRSDWGGMPFFLPDEEHQIKNNDYFCGDLQGIVEKLPYLEELGVGAIYLNPVFEAHTNHRYDTADYKKIDPLLGTNEDFKRLCKKAKHHNIQVLLDGVFSHTGADSVYFNKNGRYHSIGAYQSKESWYYSWYNFHQYPDLYESWWGFETLPNVDENNPDYVEFICGEDGVLRKWLRAGASGFRLDVADELPDQFIVQIHNAIKEENPDAYLYGEVWEDASNKESYGVKREYFQGRELDSVMNYPFKDAIIAYVKDNKAEQFIERVMTITENYPKPCLDVAMNFLSTHDTLRAITALAGKEVDYNDRVTQSRTVLDLDEYVTGVRRMKMAMVFQYFLPGIPTIYYGDEAGVQGYRDPFNRKCFPWGQENRELLEFTKLLGKLRHSCPGLADGALEFTLRDESGFISFRRMGEDGETLVFVNNSDTQDVVISSHGLEKYRLIHGKRKKENVSIPSKGFVVLVKKRG